MHQFPTKESSGREPVGVPERRAPMPWLASGTTYEDHYVPREHSLVPVMGPEAGSSYPFSGTSEYAREYIPKEGFPQIPPLTGVN